MWKRWGGIGAILLVSLAVGCADETKRSTTSEPSPQETGIFVTISFDGASSIGGFGFSVDNCQGQPVLEASLRQDQLQALQELEGLSGSIYDGERAERFADLSARLEPGCYNLEVSPLNGDGRPLPRCQVGSARELKVVKGERTEVFLAASCEEGGRGPYRWRPELPGKQGPGDGRSGGDGASGGLETRTRLNSPPRIESVYFSPSKFVFDCEIAHICVQASDPDGDDLEFVFEKLAGSRLWEGPDLVQVERNGDSITACMEAVAVWEDGYEFKVSVYDLIKVDGEERRLEELTGHPSRAEMTFPLYVNYDIELHCYDPDTQTYHAYEGVRHVERLHGCVTLWPFQYFCSDYWWEDLEMTCPEGEFKPETVYPLCEEHEKNNPVPQPWRFPDEPWTGH